MTMAKKAQAERINWKAAYGEMHLKYCRATDARVLVESECDLVNKQLGETGKQLAAMGRERDAIQGRLTLATVTLKGAAEVVKAHNPDLAAALYAQADAL
jgi:hypothetical protein